MDDLLQQGITSCSAGKHKEARKKFIDATKQNPDNARAWSWLYNVCDDDRERVHCLKQIIRINPKAEIAQLLLYKLTGDISYSNPKMDNPKSRKKLVEIKKIQEQSFQNYEVYLDFLLGEGAETYWNYIDLTGDLDNALAYADGQYSEALVMRLNKQGVRTQVRLLTAEDDKVCDICSAADHKLKDQPIDSPQGDWNGLSWGRRFAQPPFHEGCRCKTDVEKLP